MSFLFRNLFTVLVNCVYTLNIGCFTQVHISEKKYIAEKETGKKKKNTVILRTHFEETMVINHILKQQNHPRNFCVFLTQMDSEKRGKAVSSHLFGFLML